MVASLEGFRGLEHVMEPSGRIGEVSFVNDSKATNVEAARRSIESFPVEWSRSWAGTSRAATSAICVRSFASRGRAVVAMGEAAPLVREALADVAPGRSRRRR